MRYFFDTEFVEDGCTIDLISIAIVAEDGREYLAVSSEFDQRKAEAHPWVSVNVLPKLPQIPRKSRKDIAYDIVLFCAGEPEFWADYGSYDWVALCQLYGPMVDLPPGWPMFVRDIQQLRKSINEPKCQILPKTYEHNALHDARECAARYQFLAHRRIEKMQAVIMPLLEEFSDKD